MEFAPLRSFDDFLWGSARFQLPNYKDLEKWNFRVANNLLYYQTNYFLMAIILVLSVSAIHSLGVFYGALKMIVLSGLLIYLVYAKSVFSSAARFTKDHPIVGITVLSGGALFFVYILVSLVSAVGFMGSLFGILFPISVMFVHASFRLRNIKNKMANIQRAVSKKTPMGVFLDFIGMQAEITS